MALMQTVRPRVSYSDLASMPEDGRRYEIYDGEVFVVPAPIPFHQIVVLNLEDRLREWTRQHGGIVLVSPIDIVISEYDVVQPDLVFFAPARAHLVELDAPIRAIPDLVVEVLSPSTASTDRGKKLQLFARSGLPEYWLVDPALRSVEINVLRSGVFALGGRHATGERITSSAAPGFTCLVDAVFETPLTAG
jgi:Uma2 family endonuclease